MLERLKYKNHLNQIIDFGKDGIFVNSNDLHDYEWTVTKKNNMIAAFNRGVVTRKLPVVIFCETEEKGIAARNRLMEVADKDVLSFSPGQIILGDYSFKCYVTKSEKKGYLTNKRLMELTLTLTSDFPYWVKEKTIQFGVSSAGGSSGEEDFPYDYLYNYLESSSSSPINNTNFVASNFRLKIYGPCINPAIIIGNHTYKVNGTVNAGEYLTIDSTTKKIYVTGIDGTVTNVFSQRDRENYIFEKIPVGLNTVAWGGGYGFDLILLEERSEPKWT